MSKRELCLAYIVKNYKQWPAESTLSPSAASHHGYHWRKPNPSCPWMLINQHGDMIYALDYVHAYEDSVRMSDVFDTTSDCQGIRWAPLDPDALDEVKLSLTSAQWKAVCVAIRRYDGMKAKLAFAKKAANTLSNTLGE